MDPLSALKSDVFRPVATIVVPGITVLAPLVFVTIHYNPAIETFWHDQPVAFVLLIGLFLVVYPSIPIFLSPYQTSDSQQALTRVLGVAGLRIAFKGA